MRPERGLEATIAAIAPVEAARRDAVWKRLDALTKPPRSLGRLEELAAENVKRVVRGSADGQSLRDIEAFLELKTVWHPIGP